MHSMSRGRIKNTIKPTQLANPLSMTHNTPEPRTERCHYRDAGIKSDERHHHKKGCFRNRSKPGLPECHKEIHLSAGVVIHMNCP